MTSTLIPPPLRLLQPLQIPQHLLMVPGPAGCSKRVIKGLGQPMVNLNSKELFQTMEDVKSGIRYVFQTANDFTFAVCGPGNVALETAFCSIVQPGENVLAVEGHWGRRAALMTELHGGVPHLIPLPLGEVITLEKIEMALEEYRPVLLYVCHGESTIGTVQPLDGIGPLCRRYNCLLMVDAVTSILAHPVLMDAQGIDVLVSASQKTLAAPPGICPMSFSSRAIKKIKERQVAVHSYYMDVMRLAENWGCTESLGIRTHYTEPVTSIYALREALGEVVEETLEKSWQRYKKCAKLLWNGLEQLGFKCLVENEEHRLASVVVIQIPNNFDWEYVIRFLHERHNIDIAGGLGHTAGKVLRIGLMGMNANEENVNRLLAGITEALSTPTKASL